MPNLRVDYVEGVNPARWFTVWNARHPDAPVQGRRVPAALQADAVRAGEVDAAIVRGFSPEAARAAALHRVMLFAEDTVAVASRSHPLAAFGEVTLADLAGEELLDAELLGAEQAIAAAVGGAGVALVPRTVARLFGGPDAAFALVTDAPAEGVSLVWRQDRDGNDIQDFVGITRGRGVDSSRA